MIIRRIIVKSFGSVRDVEVIPYIGNNTVKYEVGYAVALLINNQFALRCLKEIPLKEDSYLYMELDGIGHDKYKAYVRGRSSVVYEKNGKVMTDVEVDKDPILTRPYREDNMAVFLEREKEDFFDFIKFVPMYISRLIPYSSEFDFFAKTKHELCVSLNQFLEFSFIDGFVPLRKASIYRYARIDNGRCNGLALRYCSFLAMSKFVTFYQSRKGKVQTYTPLLVEGVLDKIMGGIRKDLLNNTDYTGRQAFFFEKCE